VVGLLGSGNLDLLALEELGMEFVPAFPGEAGVLVVLGKCELLAVGVATD
jgi:hypothetical protein